ncbi:hypothetical protein Droror1_Dr00026812 [Drosera rotundifolia]
MISIYADLGMIACKEFEVLATEEGKNDGQGILEWNALALGLHIIRSGHVRINFRDGILRNPKVQSLVSYDEDKNDALQNEGPSIEKSNGSYFGERALLGVEINQLNAVAVGNVVCSILLKERMSSLRMYKESPRG